MSLAINQPYKFDILDYIKKLPGLGMSQEIAEVQGQVIENILEAAINNTKEELQKAQAIIKEEIHAKDLVTKGDLLVTKLELQKEMEVIRKEMEVIRREIEVVRKETAQMGNKLIIWVAGLLGTFGIFFLGILAKGFHWL